MERYIGMDVPFTYGDATPAEETYPYRVAQMLDGSSINAGVCSYGLSQMLILARRLVVKYKPDYLLGPALTLAREARTLALRTFLFWQAHQSLLLQGRRRPHPAATGIRYRSLRLPDQRLPDE